MKIKLVVLVVVLAALLLPGTSWAVYQYCTSCAGMGPNAPCTCPPSGTLPHFTTCGKYPQGCPPPYPPPLAAEPSAKDAFLASLAAQPAASPSPAK